MCNQIGAKITLLQSAENNISRIKIEYSYWRITVQNSKKDNIITITGFSSTTLIGKKQEAI